MFLKQGSHKLWKSWKTWKFTKKSSMHGKVMEFEKNSIIMEKSWSFVKKITKPPVARKLAVGHTSVQQLVLWLLVVSSFNYFKMHAWSTSMLLLLHSAFMLSVVEMLLKWEVGSSALNSHGNYIVDHGKSWNCVFEFLCKKVIICKQIIHQRTERVECLSLLSHSGTARLASFGHFSLKILIQIRPLQSFTSLIHF